MENNQWLNDFIKEVVDGWMCRDLDRLLDIPYRPGVAGNCNFPLALHTFACLEFLGYLTSPNPIDNNQHGCSRDRVMSYIDNFFPEEFMQEIQPYRNDFVNIFRNGLAHEYFAKSAGISRTESHPLQIDNRGRLNLDADCLAEAFKVSVEKLKRAIRSNSALMGRIAERYGNLCQSNLHFRVTSTATRVSGASVAPPTNLTTTTFPPPPRNGES